jgi:hypothetical protein
MLANDSDLDQGVVKHESLHADTEAMGVTGAALIQGLIALSLLLK